MANKNFKNNAKKPASSAKQILGENVEKEQVDTTSENSDASDIDFATPVVETKGKRKIVERDRVVTIMNNTSGIMKYMSKQTGQEWVFNNYGDTDEIEVGELIRIKNAHPIYLNDAWMLIMDDEVVEFLGLSNLYENILAPDEVKRFFKLSPDKIKEILPSMPDGMRQTIIGLAINGIENGTLDSMRTIRAIEEACGVELITD